MVRKHAISERLRGLVEKIRSANPQFIAVANKEWYSLFRNEIRNSIAIEGVFANRNDLRDVLELNKRTSKEKSAAILGYFEAASSMYEYASNQFKEQEFQLRLADIKQIHTLLMRYEKQMGTYSGDIGDFRKGNIEVAQATFQPIDVFYVREAMTLMVAWFNAKLADPACDKLYLAAMIHVWFETIHPFRDGNGRTGRILLSYLLIGMGFVNIAIKGTSSKDRQAYYEALERCDDNFETLHKRIEQGKTISYQDVDETINVQDFDGFVKMIAHSMDQMIVGLSRTASTSMDDDAIVPLRELAQMCNYSQDYLRNLINRGQLKAQKRGKLWHVRVGDLYQYMQEHP